MKKSALLTAALLLVSSSYAMAAPINQMANHETAVGVGTKESYIEHKVTNKATVGFQYADRDEKGDHKDAYLQYDIVGSELKVLGFDAYASYVAGKDFNETQVGVNKNLLLNVDLNVNYHNFKPDEGSRENGVGVGVSVKF